MQPKQSLEHASATVQAHFPMRAMA